MKESSSIKSVPQFLNSEETECNFIFQSSQCELKLTYSSDSSCSACICIVDTLLANNNIATDKTKPMT